MRYVKFFLYSLLFYSCSSDPIDDKIQKDDYVFLNKTFRHTKTYEQKIDGSLISTSMYFETGEFNRISVFEYDSTHTKWAYNPIYLADTIENKNNLYLGWKSWPHSLTKDYILVDWGYDNQSDTLFYRYNNETLVIEQKLYNRTEDPWTLLYSEYVLDKRYMHEWENRK